MNVVKVSSIPKTISTSRLFTGGQVTSQPIVSESKYYTISQVSFAAGSRNKFHIHSADQTLIITEGTGICATETEEVVVTVGDVVFFPAGEKHWHGATKDSAFAHIYVTGGGNVTTQVEE